MDLETHWLVDSITVVAKEKQTPWQALGDRRSSDSGQEEAGYDSEEEGKLKRG
jgi:hypothetical protein